MSGHFLDNERLAELLVRRATEGLSSADEHELAELLEKYPEADAEAIDMATAAVLLAGDWEEEPLPADVRARLDETAATFLASKVQLITSDSSPVPARRTKPAPSPLPWLLATAASVLALIAWWPQFESGTDPQVELFTQASQDLGTLAELRQRFVTAANPLLRPWTGTEDPAAQGVTGDVVWDPVTQTGYMRFSGLPQNDPAEHQYQLWIFDAARDERYPVDGGVFDIPAGADEVVVPILAKLPVADATLFAVTVERPGGAVVSSRERIVVVAPVRPG